MNKDIYALELHESTNINAPQDVWVMRVPGGWLYFVNDERKNAQGEWEHFLVTCQFVPFNNDLQPR